MINEWKNVFNMYKDKVIPNRISPDLLVEYLMNKYPLIKQNNENYKQIVIQNEKATSLYSKNKQEGIVPNIVIFELQNNGIGKDIYLKQDEVFRNIKIIIGINLATGYFTVEGSSYIWDEILAYRGLDKDEINNYYMVAEYIKCFQVFDENNEILKKIA